MVRACFSNPLSAPLVPGDANRGVARSKAIQKPADFVVVMHGGNVEVRDPQASLADILHKPVRLEKRHGLLHRLAGNAKPFCQFFLFQVRARCQLAGTDFIKDGLVDLFGKGWRCLDDVH
jgi:hypothetical protein